jgi:hypothetical protein
VHAELDGVVSSLDQGLCRVAQNLDCQLERVRESRALELQPRSRSLEDGYPTDAQLIAHCALASTHLRVSVAQSSPLGLRVRRTWHLKKVSH